MIRVAVLTASDKGSIGERTDESGIVICDLMKQTGAEVVDYVIVPDEKETLSSQLKRMAIKWGLT